MAEMLEKLKYELNSAQSLSNRLTEEVKELTKELATLKKENLTLKADKANSTNRIPPTTASRPDSTNLNTNPVAVHQDNNDDIDSKHSGSTDKGSFEGNQEYQKLDNYQLYYHTPSGYYYESVSQRFLCPCSSTYNNQNGGTVTTSEVAAVSTDINNDQTQTQSKPDSQSQSQADSQSQSQVDSQSQSETQTHQTNPELPKSESANESSSEPKSETHSSQTETRSNSKPKLSGGDIASQLAAVSDNAMQQYGFTYDESSGYYYDQRTGLYYDQSNGLYYNSQQGTYYTFNTESGQYKAYYSLDLEAVEAVSKVINSSNNQQEATPHIVERETMSLESRVVHESKMYLEMIQELEAESPVEEGQLSNSPPPENEWPPCVRMVPRQDAFDEATNESDARRNISVITAEGVEIGRDVNGPQSLRIMSLQVSKLHCEIRYLRRRESFAVTDLGSQNGTYLNGERISEAKEKSKPHLLLHRDVLTIGSTPFLLHIHHGLASCPDCAQIGMFRAPSDATTISSEPVYNESLEDQRRKELNKIKKKYGLRTKDTYNEKPYQLPDQYTDKSAERRLTVGSELPESAIRDDLPSSTTRAISDDNKGKQMLKQLGWQEGKGLGRDNSGIQEPVTAVVRGERSGLGFGGTAHVGSTRSLDSSAVRNQRLESHGKMVQHYQQVIDREAKRKKTE